MLGFDLVLLLVPSATSVRPLAIDMIVQTDGMDVEWQGRHHRLISGRLIGISARNMCATCPKEPMAVWCHRIEGSENENSQMLPYSMKS